jgi:CRP-like cAMP-binding protein
LGGLILLLVNVYFFFILFFLGAQLAYVIDSFDILLFSKLRYIRNEASRNLIERKIFSTTESHLKKYLRSYTKGDILFYKGDHGSEVYFLISGKVAIYLQDTTDSSTKKISTLESGVFFGEMEFLLAESRTATVKAETDIVVMCLPPALFDQLLRSDPTISRTIIENLSQRLKVANEKLSELQGK